jgi:2-oxoglutarate/2-oxoacid ferredoxin oxidoreductase subunit alpha
MTPTASDSSPAPAGRGVNDFALKIGTVNGTGSASANTLLRQAIFRMGIPVSGKNLFPSNIQGLPTWYEIRVNGRGYTARSRSFDLFVTVNPASYERDIREVREGGWVMHDSSWPLREELRRPDVTFLDVPMAALCREHFKGDRERILMKNIVYVGALGALLELDLDVVRGLLEETFARKKALLESNFLALELGYDHAKAHLPCPLPIRLEAMDATRDAILIDGNTAAALGCIYAGATVAAWYPITPSTSLVDAFTGFCHEFRKDPETGGMRGIVIQAEDELAAAGMVVGAGWAGARAFTATSGPGISLMGEFIGLAYYAEVPSVFFDVQRTGPSTGMPTRTQQGDLLSVAYASHGDTKHIALFPADPGECFHDAVQAFDLAERFQTPVFVVSDLDIGMNDWMVPRMEWDDGYVPDRGKVLGVEELEAMDRFHRYLDVDGDGIPWRTLPGVHPKGAYFTRGSGHDRFGRYTEDEEGYTEVVDRIARKIESAASALPEPVVRRAGRDRANDGDTVEGEEGAGDGEAGDALGILALGGVDRAVSEAVDLLAGEGVRLDYLRVRGFPFHPRVGSFLAEHPRTFVVEQNRDAQLRMLLIAEEVARADDLVSVRRYGGLPLSATDVVESIRDFLGRGVPSLPADGEVPAESAAQAAPDRGREGARDPHPPSSPAVAS